MLSNDISRCPGTTDPLCSTCRRRERIPEGCMMCSWITADIMRDSFGSRCRNYLPYPHVEYSNNTNGKDGAK